MLWIIDGIARNVSAALSTEIDHQNRKLGIGERHVFHELHVGIECIAVRPNGRLHQPAELLLSLSVGVVGAHDERIVRLG